MNHTGIRNLPLFSVGILYSIENEFDDCLASIRSQQRIDSDLFIIRDKPKKEAHDELYSTFMSRADKVDFFAKIDADMVLLSPTIFARVAERFAELPEVEMITIRLQDYFLEELIYGMHFYRSSVRWEPRHSDLFTDHDVERNRHVMLEIGEENIEVTHCQNPSPFQSFHFGVHRGLKLRGSLDGPKEFLFQAKSHSKNISFIGSRYLKTNDLRRGYAALGAELGLAGIFSVQDIPYTNPNLEKYFNAEVASLSPELLRKKHRVLAIKNRCLSPRVGFYQLHRKLLRSKLSFLYHPITRLFAS